MDREAPKTLTAKALKNMLRGNLKQVLAYDAQRAAQADKDGYFGTSRARAERRVYFSHTGLARRALEKAVAAKKWFDYAVEKIAE